MNSLNYQTNLTRGSILHMPPCYLPPQIFSLYFSYFSLSVSSSFECFCIYKLDNYIVKRCMASRRVESGANEEAKKGDMNDNKEG